ncbi:hypothetical protein C4J88_2909 [Pseudomonas sp. R4-39-08]|nr:hypothetical protein C4J88_2909 [Pseudomonas sp. R4-39-08]
MTVSPESTAKSLLMLAGSLALALVYQMSLLRMLMRKPT